ncbi:unnamed protein product [Darwinula stevensoni]|uniref:Uncharacterized protein n=1 Tax=Darwinula stevensoni TaxID=69355 RepID=A0A7R9A7L6_9CRUS|nr:unnamed protein product [Darwinula stevensoni]CAG0893953.1 unnamed protein product [Darwinula stevensoni]
MKKRMKKKDIFKAETQRIPLWTTANLLPTTTYATRAGTLSTKSEIVNLRLREAFGQLYDQDKENDDSKPENERNASDGTRENPQKGQALNDGVPDIASENSSLYRVYNRRKVIKEAPRIVALQDRFLRHIDQGLDGCQKECEYRFRRLKEVTTPTQCQGQKRPDVRDYLQVDMGGSEKKPFTEAAEEYLQQHYPKAGKTHYSLPSDYLLKDTDIEERLSQWEIELEKPNGEDVDLRPEHKAVARVFERIKNMCGSYPSLLVADYKFCETFRQPFNQALSRMNTRERERLEEAVPDLNKGSHKQKRLVDDNSAWLLLIAGGSGTGKTIVVKERAKRLLKEEPSAEVVVVNLPGGYLTEHYLQEFQGIENILVIDGMQASIPETCEGIIDFLKQNGRGKHVMFDEVPLTLGIHGQLDEMRLSQHWAKISTSRIKKIVRSLTLAFRPNDATYTKDINLQSIRIAVIDYQILGYHQGGMVVIMDLAETKWRNYIRMISSCCENVTIVMEEDGLRTGKYFPIMGMNVSTGVNLLDDEAFHEKLTENMERAQELDEKVMAQLDENKFHRMTVSLEKLGSLPSGVARYASRFKTKQPQSTVILGPPSSGKSELLCESIQRLANEDPQKHRALLLHFGSPLSRKVSLHLLQERGRILNIVFSESCSPRDIVDNAQLEVERCMYPEATIHIHVDDYRIQAKNMEEEFRNWTEVLDEIEKEPQKMTLTIAFQSHSRGGRKISINDLKSMFMERDFEVIILPEPESLSHCTSDIVLKHISQNETHTPLKLEAKNLPTASRSGALVLGPKPMHITMKYKCPGRHLKYDCKGETHCMPYMGAFFCFRFALDQEMGGEPIHVLVSDEKLLYFLQAFSKYHKNKPKFFHPKDFRGCESSVSIAVNVDDAWLLESISRSRMNLFIIDCLPDHQQVWSTMQEEGHLEIQVKRRIDVDIDTDTLLSLDYCGNFLSEHQKFKEFQHKCDYSKKIATLSQLQKFEKEDPRRIRRTKVPHADYEKLPFPEGAKEYQKKFYPMAEERFYSFPAGYLLKEKVQEKLFDGMKKAGPNKEAGRYIRIPHESRAVARLFNFLKEELINFPSFVTYEYDFATTFYRSMGITGRGSSAFWKGYWKSKGIDILPGEHDIFGIVLDGKRVVALFFEVKSRERIDAQYPMNHLVGKAEYKLSQGNRVFQQIFGKTAFSCTFMCSFVAFPFLSRKKLTKSLLCDCNKNILTKDDLESRDVFRKFLHENGITLTKQDVQNPVVKECYLDVMRTYVAATASMEGIPRTAKDLCKDIGKRMKSALHILTPHQSMILLEERNVLFLVGGPGTGKTRLILERAQKLAKKGESVIIVNMSGGQLSSDMGKWHTSHKFKSKITVMESAKLFGSDRITVGSFLEKINARKQQHILIDGMTVNFGMEGNDPEEIGRRWRNVADKIECKSLWIVWRSSYDIYRSQISFDFQRVIDLLGEDKVEQLTELDRRTKELGEFLFEASLFIERKFKCMLHLPMQGLNYGLQQKEDLVEVSPKVIFVNVPLNGTKDEWVSLWASDAAYWVRRGSEDSGCFTLITRTSWERNLITLELRKRLKEKVAFLDSQGILQGHSMPGFLILYQHQVTGISFKNVILLDDEYSSYQSWSRMVSMARTSLHIITTNRQLSSRHWEEPGRLGLITSYSLRQHGQKAKDALSDEMDLLDLDLDRDISWTNLREVDDPPNFELAEFGKKRIEIVFGPNRSGKTAYLMGRLKRQTESSPGQDRCIFVDSSRWDREIYPSGLSLADINEKIRLTGLKSTVDVVDIHVLLEQHGLGRKVSPGVITELLVKIHQMAGEEVPRVHVVIDDAPVHPIDVGECLDTQKVGIVVQEGCRDAGFPSLLDYVLRHESPKELRMGPRVLNTKFHPTSIVFGEKPTLITPPLQAHNHGGFKCFGGSGGGCVAITAAAYFHSHIHEKWVVLISDDETKAIFTEALNMKNEASGPTFNKRLRIFHPREYRGCESPRVMCVGIDDSWMLEAISRAIHTLTIVEEGNIPVTRSRMALWIEMERRGLLLHRIQESSPVLDYLSQDDWIALNDICNFLKV